MRKKRNEQTLENVLKAFVGQKKIKRGYSEADIKKFWNEQMGQTIAQYTKSVRYRNGLLSVEITSIPLRTELQYSKDKLIKLLQQEFDQVEIKDIRIH